MRYVVQFLIPALVIIIVTLVLIRNRGGNPPAAPSTPSHAADSGPLSTGTFMLILVIGAIFTVALIYALHASSGS